MYSRDSLKLDFTIQIVNENNKFLKQFILFQLNESVADSCVVNTVFSFVDREKTAKENVTNPTETALAQLYAHIQSLPESSKKRKLVKQFNKENGYGTPKRVLLNNNDKAPSLTKNISDSLKVTYISSA